QAREDGLLREGIRILRPRPGVRLLDEEPFLAVGLVTALRADQLPVAPQLVALEREEELSLPEPFLDVLEGLPAALVPDDDGAGSVVSSGDDPLEVRVLDRMVLDLDGQALDG